MEFYGFADEHGALIHDEIIATPPAYMLVKLNHDVGINVALPGLPPSVIGSSQKGCHTELVKSTLLSLSSP